MKIKNTISRFKTQTAAEVFIDLLLCFAHETDTGNRHKVSAHAKPNETKVDGKKGIDGWSVEVELSCSHFIHMENAECKRKDLDFWCKIEEHASLLKACLDRYAEEGKR